MAKTKPGSRSASSGLQRPSKPAGGGGAPPRDGHQTVTLLSVLRRYRFESVGIGLIVLFTSTVLVWPMIRPDTPAPPPPIPTPRATSTAVTVVTDPTPRAYVPPRLTAEQAINHMKAQPVQGVAFTSRAGYSNDWTAEYRGDGSWWVRAGEATWLLFDDSMAYMPANLAAIQLEGRGRRTVK